MSALGHLKPSELAILTGTRMRAATSTARMWTRLRREAIRASRHVDIAGPGGGYRDADDLVDIQRQWLGKSHHRDWRLLPGSGAMPSLNSVHGLGRCLDFTGDVAWIKQVSLDWGLTFPLVHLGDINHGQHDGRTRGDAGLLPYEVKRLARYIAHRTSTPVGAARTGKRGLRGTTNYWRGLAKLAAADHLTGTPVGALEQHYLDREAGIR